MAFAAYSESRQNSTGGKLRSVSFNQSRASAIAWSSPVLFECPSAPTASLRVSLSELLSEADLERVQLEFRLAWQAVQEGACGRRPLGCDGGLGLGANSWVGHEALVVVLH